MTGDVQLVRKAKDEILEIEKNWTEKCREQGIPDPEMAQLVKRTWQEYGLLGLRNEIMRRAKKVEKPNTGADGGGGSS